MLTSFSILGFVKKCHLNSVIRFSFFNLKNFIKIFLPLSTIWLSYRKGEITACFFSFLYRVVRIMSWFAVMFKKWPISFFFFQHTVMKLIDLNIFDLFLFIV